MKPHYMEEFERALAETVATRRYRDTDYYRVSQYLFSYILALEEREAFLREALGGG